MSLNSVCAGSSARGAGRVLPATGGSGGEGIGGEGTGALGVLAAGFFKLGSGGDGAAGVFALGAWSGDGESGMAAPKMGL